MKEDKNYIPDKKTLLKTFEAGEESRYNIAKSIEARMEKAFSLLHSPPTIKLRLKKFPSYYRKYILMLKNGIQKPQITDMIGIRVICPFNEDLQEAEKIINEQFEVNERDVKGNSDFKEFGYESTHLLIKIPDEILKAHGQSCCKVAEVQIRTILQDAWAEVEHELFYKTEFNPIDMPMKRKLAAVNASLSLADWIFQEIRNYQKQLNSQLGKKRDIFHQKIEEKTDALLFANTYAQKISKPLSSVTDVKDISRDDLLLMALVAQNENRFEEAIIMYSRILELKPEGNISSLIYTHRGMAYFAESKYKEAIADFSLALKQDENSYKAAYYRGVVKSVLKLYSEAIDDYNLSLEINPYQVYCLLRRGQAYYHIGDYPQALSDCEACLSLEPNNKTIQKFLALLKDKLKM